MFESLYRFTESPTVQASDYSPRTSREAANHIPYDSLV